MPLAPLFVSTVNWFAVAEDWRFANIKCSDPEFPVKVVLDTVARPLSSTRTPIQRCPRMTLLMIVDCRMSAVLPGPSTLNILDMSSIALTSTCEASRLLPPTVSKIVCSDHEMGSASHQPTHGGLSTFYTPRSRCSGHSIYQGTWHRCFPSTLELLHSSLMHRLLTSEEYHHRWRKQFRTRHHESRHRRLPK